MRMREIDRTHASDLSWPPVTNRGSHVKDFPRSAEQLLSPSCCGAELAGDRRRQPVPRPRTPSRTGGDLYGASDFSRLAEGVDTGLAGEVDGRGLGAARAITGK